MKADVVVIGAGIVGLAHAWAAARRGKSVVVYERDAKAQSASVRNFGMVWPVGQPPGPRLATAMLSRSYWTTLGDAGALWLRPCGSLHLARHDDELAVLTEFADRSKAWGYDCELLTPAETLRRCPAANADGLRAGLWSSTECVVDPRQAVANIPAYLAEKHGVQFRFRTTVTRVLSGKVFTAAGAGCEAGRVVVCSGSDFETLLPDAFKSSGIRRCKLQMMRTPPQPGGMRLGPHLAGGLTLCHYTAFSECPSLPALKARIDATMPEYVRLGIHVMASQNERGEVVIGDSHEYDGDIEIFDKAEIDDLILSYLRTMVNLPEPSIAARWHGVYAKHPTQAIFTAEPMPGVAVRVAPGGAGMTMSFGLAEEWFRDLPPLAPASGEKGRG